MKSGMTEVLYAASSFDPSIGVRLAVDLNTGEYATYINKRINGLENVDDDMYGHYFQCEGARHLAHKFATDDFFERLKTGL